MKTKLAGMLALLAGALALAAKTLAPGLTGDYLEVRSCDIYTGACVANSEMNLTGKEGMLVWSVRSGTWKGVALDGLSIAAVIRADGTLMDQRYMPRSSQAVLIVDARAGSAQQAALKEFARAMAGSLIREVTEVKVAKLDVAVGRCQGGSCATVKAENLLEISTRCLGKHDHLCGNEENYYPPLTQLEEANSAFTEIASYHGTGLGVTWTQVGRRSAYLGSFAL